MPPPSRPDAFGRSFRALLSPRPYRDMNAHAVGFMTIRQVMWVFDFSQIQASAKLQITQETMCALVAVATRRLCVSPTVAACHGVTRGIGPELRAGPGLE